MWIPRKTHNHGAQPYQGIDQDMIPQNDISGQTHTEPLNGKEHSFYHIWTANTHNRSFCSGLSGRLQSELSAKNGIGSASLTYGHVVISEICKSCIKGAQYT